MPNVIGVGQISLMDLNDALISGVAPKNPTVGSLWIDESQDPPMLKKWNGEAWIDLGELDPNLSVVIEEVNETLGNMSNDNIINFQERQVAKDKITEIIGYVISDSATSLPTTSTLDNSGKGSFWSVRKSATNVGISTNDATYKNVATKYNELKSYLESLTPINIWDLRSGNKDVVISVVKSTFRDKWLQYYLAVDAMAELTAQKIKENNDAVDNRVDDIETDLGEIEGRVTDVELEVGDESIIAKVTSSENWTNLNNDVDTAKSTADSKSKTFTSQPTPPYKLGDIWKNGGSIYVCTTASSSSYSSSHWTKVGDVTSNNTAYDTSRVNGTSASTIKSYATNGNNAKSTLDSKEGTWDTATSDVNTLKNTTVPALEQRVSDAELKITDSAIVSTVRESTSYLNDLGEKVGEDEIISKINQTAESIKIQASKIDISGAVTFSTFDSDVQSRINQGMSAKSTLDSKASVWDGKETPSGAQSKANNAESNAKSHANTRIDQLGDLTNYASWDKVSQNTSPWEDEAVRDTNQYHSYVASLRMPPRNTGIGLKRKIAVKQGDKIYYEFWIKTSSNWNGSNSNSKLRFGDQNGALKHNIGYQGVKTSWKKYSGTWTIPSSVTALSVSIGNDGSTGNVWIDDIIIVKQTSDEYIVNSGKWNDAKSKVDLWKYGNTTYIDGGYIRTGTVDAGVLKANSVIAKDIKFTGTLEGATGTFSGQVSVSGVNNRITLKNDGTLESIKADNTVRTIINEQGMRSERTLTDGTLQEGTMFFPNQITFFGREDGGVPYGNIDYSIPNMSLEVYNRRGRLHLRGLGVEIESGGNDPTIYLGRTSGHESIKSTDAWLIMDSGSSPAALNYYSSSHVILARGGGRVGIGSDTSPDYKLDVQGNGRFDSTLSVGSSLSTGGDVDSSGRVLASDYVYSDALEQHPNSSSSHIYIRPNGGELRVTQAGTTGTYRDIHANGATFEGFITTGGAMDNNGGGKHHYIRTKSDGEIRATVNGSTTSYRPVRGSSHPTSSSILTKTNWEEFTLDEAYYLLDSADIWKYHIDSNVQAGIYDKPKIGMISQMVPSLLRDEDGVDPYSIVSALWRIVQDQNERIKSLEQNQTELYEII